jgi:drug/metabolite transporter (DMT)-like permease
MLSAGIAWGIYSLRGKGVGDPIQVTAGNFLRTLPISAILIVIFWNKISVNNPGFWYAALSGALTSGIGYAIWYTALPNLKATTAATVQLSVPVIAGLGGIFFLGESLTWRLGLASVAILGGVVMVILERKQARGI